jgi:hypothetical protein
MRIGEHAEQTALNPSAIRYYEKSGLLALRRGLADNGVTRPTRSIKIAELETRLDRTKRLLDLLRRLQHCHCVQLHQCVSALAASPRVQALSRCGQAAPGRRRRQAK